MTAIPPGQADTTQIHILKMKLKSNQTKNASAVFVQHGMMLIRKPHWHHTSLPNKLRNYPASMSPSTCCIWTARLVPPMQLRVFAIGLQDSRARARRAMTTTQKSSASEYRALYVFLCLIWTALALGLQLEFHCGWFTLHLHGFMLHLHRFRLHLHRPQSNFAWQSQATKPQWKRVCTLWRRSQSGRSSIPTRIQWLITCFHWLQLRFHLRLWNCFGPGCTRGSRSVPPVEFRCDPGGLLDHCAQMLGLLDCSSSSSGLLACCAQMLGPLG